MNSYYLHKFLDMLIIFKYLPILDVIRNRWFVPHINFILNLRYGWWFESIGFQCYGICLLIELSKNINDVESFIKIFYQVPNLISL
jgi:hypothetical protein